MPIEVTMPRLSDTMEQGTIVAWNVKEGDTVSAGDVLGDIETDKATMELQSFDDGVIASLVLSEGETVDVGALICVIAEDGEDAAQIKSQYEGGAAPAGAAAPGAAEQGAAEGSSHATPTNGAATATATAAPAPGSGDGGRIFASPLARKIALEKGVDLSTLHGSGPSGRIVKKDVEAAQPGAAPAAAPMPQPASRTPTEPSQAGDKLSAATVPGTPAPAELPSYGGLQTQTIQLSNMRRTIAKRLVESKTTVPHYQVTVQVRMDGLMEFRKQLNAQLDAQGVKLSVNDFLVRACALAMHQHPFVNASWGADNASIQINGNVNVGVAIALPVNADLTGGGLVVGVLRDADRMGLRAISDTTKALATKARDRGLTIDEMDGATFTISNLGMFGVEHFTAIINPPNTAILAVGAAVKKPVVGDDGQLTVGHEMSMTMSSDHRVVDGAMAAQYLNTVKGMLESPATLLV